MLELIRADIGVWSLVILFAAAALEYMVPPLPADSVVLSGSLVVLSGAFPFAVVAGSVIVGGFLGALSHYALGRWLVTPDGSIRGRDTIERLTGRGSLDRFTAAFRRFGIWVIAVNRMFPGIRGGVFLAAGVSRLPVVPVMLLGLVSNVLWSLAILGVGVMIGGNLEKLQAWLDVYKTAAASVLGLALLGWFAWRFWKRRKA